MQDIADVLGIRKPSLYRHFDGKDELYGAVLEHILVPYAQAIDEVLEGAEPGSTGKGLPAKMIRMLHDEPRAARLLLQELIQVDRPLHPRVDEWLQLLFAKADHIFSLATRQVGRSAAEERLILLTSFNVVLGFIMAEPLLPASDTDREQLLAMESKILETVLVALHGTPAGLASSGQATEGAALT